MHFRLHTESQRASIPRPVTKTPARSMCRVFVDIELHLQITFVSVEPYPRIAFVDTEPHPHIVFVAFIGCCCRGPTGAWAVRDHGFVITLFSSTGPRSATSSPPQTLAQMTT
ncbi:hypothetical protein B0H14DRAFT_3515642 [Mycena olivaceomarginata]|nr:hypothetical protein B0H14DRAFT_3515642 [Mycena olivaceomarginata]